MNPSKIKVWLMLLHEMKVGSLSKPESTHLAHCTDEVEADDNAG